jgi:hypothetical protein
MNKHKIGSRRWYIYDTDIDLLISTDL